MKQIPSILDIPTVAVSSGKGGAGKSTTAAAIAARLVADGNTVTLIDGDTAAPNAHFIAGIHNIDELRVIGDHDALTATVPTTPLGYQLLSPYCATTKRGVAGFGTLYGIAGFASDDTDIIVIDCPPGWTDTHNVIARRQPIWLLTVLNTIPAIADHHGQVRQIVAAHKNMNKTLRESDQRRKWSHLRPEPSIGAVEVLADRPVLSAITPDRSVAEETGDHYLGSLPTVTDLADLIASPEVGAVSAWISEQAAAWTPST